MRDLRRKIRPKPTLLDWRDGGKTVYAETPTEIEPREQLAIEVECTAAAGLSDPHHPVIGAVISRAHSPESQQ
jgi:hypothetical protein